MQQHGKCIHSGFARHVYAFCEKDTMHDKAIKDMPITVPLLPLTGRSEKTLRFTVTPRTDNGNHWPVPELHEVKLIFKEVDSPAAWTAQKHGCHLVENLTIHNDTDPVLNSIVGSGDAICLLEKECSLEQACQLIDTQGLGATSTKGFVATIAGETVHPPSLLERHAIVKAMICLQNGQTCNIANDWDYQSGKLSLRDHGAQIDLNTLLETVAKFGEDGLAFLQQMEIWDPEEDTQFHKDLPKATWEVSNLTAQLVTAVARVRSDMPTLLLRAFVVSKSSTGPPFNYATESEAQDFQSVFASVERLEVALEDASQVERAAIALDLAPNVGFFTMLCACPQEAKEPSPDAWLHLFPHFKKLHLLFLSDLVMTNTRVGEAVEKELSAATGLKFLDLGGMTTGSNGVHLARAASQLNLETLIFCRSDGGSAGAFLKELEANPPKSLTTLWIYSNNLGPQRGQVLPQLLQKLPNLSQLAISDNQLGDELGKNLATALQGSNLRLRSLKARGNDFSEETMQKMLGWWMVHLMRLKLERITRKDQNGPDAAWRSMPCNQQELGQLKTWTLQNYGDGLQIIPPFGRINSKAFQASHWSKKVTLYPTLANTWRHVFCMYRFSNCHSMLLRFQISLEFGPQPNFLTALLPSLTTQFQKHTFCHVSHKNYSMDTGYILARMFDQTACTTWWEYQLMRKKHQLQCHGYFGNSCV